MEHVEPFYDCCGVIHVHTTASDGGIDLPDLVRTAEAVELDFIVLGDHNIVDPRHTTIESPITVVPGVEYTPGYTVEYDNDGSPVRFSSNPNHLLAIGLSDPGNIDHANPQANINTVTAHGGLSFLAHPADYWLPWNDWGVEGFTGLEIWTYLSDWAEAALNAPSGLFAYRNPDSVLNGPKAQVLYRWDREGSKRRVVGIGATDSHGKNQIVHGKPMHVFPYEHELQGLRTHILLPGPLAGNRAKAIQQIISAISGGRCYVALDSLANATGFQFWLDAGHRRYDMGDEVNLAAAESDWTLHVRLPKAATTSVEVNGEIHYQALGRYVALQLKPQPGVYRVEATINGHIWILSNPIYLRA